LEKTQLVYIESYPINPN